MRVVESDLLKGVKKVYLIGIGGAGMSALARVLKHFGMEVGGSDLSLTPTVLELSASGIPVKVGQTEPIAGDPDIVIYSSAIHSNHAERKWATQTGKKIYHRAEILASLFNRAGTSVGVTGTHGKTTTSSMISFILKELKYNPTCLIGGDLKNFGTNAILGSRDLIVSEVDESDRSHEFYAPNYSVITNLEADHMDNYATFETLKESFSLFFTGTRNPGLIIYNTDDPVCDLLVRASGKPFLTFGIESGTADFSAGQIDFKPQGVCFDLFESGFFSTQVQLALPGQHNVYNALAALAVVSQLGVDLQAAASCLSRFIGAQRRLEIKWRSEHLCVIDDYAHHPTEVKASLRALSHYYRPLTVIFQPHRYSRTKFFYREFKDAFRDADELILTDIYAAGEPNPDGVDASWIYREVCEAGHPNVRMVKKEDILNNLLQRTNPSGVVAFLGAGDIEKVAAEYATCMQNSYTSKR